MSLPSAPDPSRMDPSLAAHLHTVAARLRATLLHRFAMWRWLIVTALGVALLSLRAWREEFTTFTGVALAVVFFVALLRGFLVARHTPLDHAAAAQIIEKEFPDLKLVLRTAAEQTPEEAGGRFNFLQRRVIDESLRHARRHPWTLRARRQARWMLFGHGAALGATLAIATLVLQRSPVPVPWVTTAQKVAVSPGNVERERGSTLVIDARITGGRSVRRVELVWRDAAGKSGRLPMGRSFGDPVYASTLPRVSADLTYFVAYDGGETEKFKVTVFDQPALVRADAALSFPKYVGRADQTIQNTRRVSAITGTQLQYDFTVNKPLASAVLRDETGAETKLTPANAERTKFTMSMTIATTHTYSLALTDDQARPNPAATPIIIAAVDNKPPTVALVFPRSDVRVSSLEEMRLSARATDDIGLNDYGIAIAVGEQAPTYVSLKGLAPPTPTPAAPPARGGAAANQPNSAVLARFEEMLALEPKGIKPDDLVTWFAWAEDFGPDGKTRRATSDLAFAEVRPFEEIFLEASAAEAQAQQRQQQQRQQGGGQQQGGNDELLDLQRQISTAIFNLSKQTEPGATYAEDLQTLRDEQQRAKDMLEEAKADLTNSRQQAAAEQAARFMNQVTENLAAAGDKKSLDPLSPAWTGAQGAYQALLKLQARETRVAQQQRGQGGQQQQRSRNQSQLNQLDFNQQRQQQEYQTENEAQEPTTQEQRDQLAVQSRLNELARRQNDVNQRLQELQTALNAARDEPQREQIRRELQRLEEEQRDMLATLDEARQRVENLQPGEQTQQTRQQLDQARQDMQRAVEQLTQRADQQLTQDNIQQALAAGNRTREQLDQTRQELQRQSSSQFAEQMRSARQQARDLTSQQQQIEQQIQQAGQAGASQLDDSAQRQALAQNLDRQRANLDRLMQNLQEVTDASETTEPALHTQLYDLLRQQAQTQAQTDIGNRLQAGAELLRRGFVDQSREEQAGVAQGLDQLRRGVERAADSVLGDETQTLQFAQNELNDLARQLEQDRQNSAGGQQAAQDAAAAAANSQQQLAQNGGPGEQGAQPGGNNPGENGNQPGGQNPSGQPGAQGNQPGALAQNDPNGAGRQPGQPGGQGAQPGTSEDFRNQAPDSNLAQNGAAGQRGQPGQNGAQGQPGQGDATSEQFAQNSGQPGGGQGQQPGQRGGAGQQPGQRGGQAGQGGQPGDLAQNDPNGAGQQPGGQGQGRQGGAGQPNGQGDQPGALAQGGAQRGVQGQGQQPGQRGGQGGQAGQPGDLAQNDPNGAGQQPGGQGGGGQQPGQRGGQGGQQPGGLAQNGQNPGGQQPGQAGAGGGQQPGQPGQRGGQGQPGGQLAQNGGNRQNGGGGGGAFNNGGNFNGGDTFNPALAGLNQLAQNLGNLDPQFGPLTGENYVQWTDRLRTVEQLIDDPALRQQVADARARADALRRSFNNTSTPPQWAEVQKTVLTPLNMVRTEIAKELARRNQPDTLQAADRDPVPAKYADAVSSYFEALGAAK